MPSARSPYALIIAGPNGAGKSTLAPFLLAGEMKINTFVNADVIAQGLSGFDPLSAAIQAGRIMHARLELLRRERADFAFETTLSGLALQRTIRDLHASGYFTHLAYLWLPNPELAVQRVQLRVQMGGHHVPAGDVRRRFFRSVHNLDRVYRRLVSEWRVYHGLRDPEVGEAPLIASGTAQSIGEIREPEAWAALQAHAASGE